MGLEGRRVLFISYNGMLDPLGQSQVIPYLRELSENEGVHFTLLSYERAGAFTPDGASRCAELEKQLTSHHIEWHRLRYHQRPSLPATAYDVKMGVRYAKTLVRKNRIELVHARSHVPAAIALALKKSFGLKMIFDIRGLMAEEYADAGHWQEGGLKYRLTKQMERDFFAASDGIVMLTDAIWKKIKEWEGLSGRAVAYQVIPCCVDLRRFSFDATQRERRREELGLSDSFVLVYSGSIGGWYLEKEMADFFLTLLQRQPHAHFLWLTQTAREKIDALMRERGIAESSYSVRSVHPSDVASYLSASDAGIAFIKPCFSKLAASPTKSPEYLACGLPIILNAGIGDSDSLVVLEKTGALVNGFTRQDYAQAIDTISVMLQDAGAVRLHTRSVAERLFDVRTVGRERYAQLYKEVMGELGRG